MSTKAIVIDGVKYVPEGTVTTGVPATKLKGLKYCIVRSKNAGVFAGYVKERVGQEATVLNARRIYYWSGAATLSQLSQEGVTKPNECKFPAEVPEVQLLEVIEVIECSEAARLNIANVPIWKM